MRTLVHRIAADHPADTGPVIDAAGRGAIDLARVVAVLGKTEGNGCVNDFTRGYATHAFAHAVAAATGETPAAVEARIAFVMSGGTEGGLSPHWLVVEVRPDGEPARSGEKRLAVGVAFTPDFLPEEIGRGPQVDATAAAVRAAMAQAGIADPADVHYVQVKCPLLTKARIAEAAARGKSVAVADTYASMGWSRGASALGVAVALGEVARAAATDAAVCADAALYSARASTSAGVELMRNLVMVAGNAAGWGGDLVIGHGLMRDAIDVGAVGGALRAAGLVPALPLGPEAAARVVAVLAKAEPSRDGRIRGHRHVMLDDSDIHASRHARALVGGVLAAVFGDTRLFVSGGAEHQGPDGGGPVAVIARVAG